MPDAFIDIVQDANVDEGRPNWNSPKPNRIHLSQTMHGFFFFSRTIPDGAMITKAIFRVYAGPDWIGTGLDVQRVASKWTVNRITAGNMPGLTGPVISIYKADPVKGTTYDFDIKSMLQTVVDSGANWYGLRLTSGRAARQYIYGSTAKQELMRVEVELEWSDAPEAPTDLRPANDQSVSDSKPVLQFDFTDITGDDDMSAYQVQLSSTGIFTGTLTFDSGWTLSGVPQADLSQIAGAWVGLADGETIHWRVRVRDASGQESEWSDPVSFNRSNKGALSLVNPGLSPNDFVTDTSPPIVWDTTFVQSAYRVWIYNEQLPDHAIWDSGKISSEDKSVGVPPRKIRNQDGLYRVVLRVWDTVNRTTTPGDTAWYQISRQFRFVKSTTVAPVTDLSAIKEPNFPQVALQFTQATAADSITIMRDGIVVEEGVLPGDTVHSGTTHRYYDRGWAGRKPHTWEVIRVVNGVASANNPTVTENHANVAPWLMEEDGSNAITLFDADVDPGLSEDSEVLYPQGASPVLVTSALYGLAPEASGRLVNNVVDGLDAETMLRRFLRLREKRGQMMRFMWHDHNILGHLYDCKYTTIAMPDGTTEYEVSFGFIEQDF